MDFLKLKNRYLLHHWGEKFDQHKWEKLTSKVCFHKLAFRESKMITNSKDNDIGFVSAKQI